PLMPVSPNLSLSRTLSLPPSAAGQYAVPPRTHARAASPPRGDSILTTRNPRRHGDGASPPPRPVLARLSSRGWSRTRRPSPRTRPRTTAPWTAGRVTARSPPSLMAPRQSAPRPQILLPSSATSPRSLVRDPQLLQRWEEPYDDMLRRPCIRKKATWIGDMYLGLGLKGQSLSICISTIEDLKLTWTAL
uniref:Uncharacterized protein n=2 Tax=Aegilops tauschii subsp. strangulata TaxID=200361 RepID=A0A453T451_AEGTS